MSRYNELRINKRISNAPRVNLGYFHQSSQQQHCRSLYVLIHLPQNRLCSIRIPFALIFSKSGYYYYYFYPAAPFVIFFVSSSLRSKNHFRLLSPPNEETIWAAEAKTLEERDRYLLDVESRLLLLRVMRRDWGGYLGPGGEKGEEDE